MRENYEKPMIMIEEYAIDTAIAAGCETIVSLGPGGLVYDSDTGNTVIETACEEYNQGTFDSTLNFYDESTCSCYYSSGGSVLLSS